MGGRASEEIYFGPDKITQGKKKTNKQT